VSRTVAPCDTFLVAILDPAGQPVGLGVLVGDGEVLTCAHVVNAALEQDLRAAAQPARPVRVRWPNLAGSAPVEATVVAWRSLADGDLAALKLVGDVPAVAVAAQLDPTVPLVQGPLRVFGYPAGRPRGQWADVQLAGAVQGGWLQLNSADVSTPDVRSGFSGSPVHDPRTGTVVGLIAEAPAGGQARDSLAIPAEQLLAFRPGLAAAARQPGTGTARPDRSYGPAAELTVLHLSDTQFGKQHLFGGNGLADADRDRDSLFGRLHADLAKVGGSHGLWPDLVVVTGDLAERGLRSEFDQVTGFLDRLVAAVGLPKHRVAIVPGNHDINRKACEQYFLGAEADEREPWAPYWPKWRHYADAFDRFYTDTAPERPRPEFVPERPWTLFEMDDLRVVVAGLNSTMAESHRDADHYGWIGEEQLSWFAEQLRPYHDAGWLVLGAVHHNAVRGAINDAENLRDADDLDRILGHGAPGYPPGDPGPLHLLLHGHTHDGRAHRLPSGLLALSTGSAAVAATARPAAVPNQYQLLTLHPDHITRHTRAYLTDHRTWTGDNRADTAHDTWQHTEPAALTAPAALKAAATVASPAAQDTDDEQDAQWRDGRPRRVGLGPDDGWDSAGTPARPDVSDPFLIEVAEVTRLRYDGAEVVLYPSPDAGRSYLRVTRATDEGPIERWPIGAVAGPLTADALQTFVEHVDTPMRSLDSNLRSLLVYGGRPPPEDVRELAQLQGVRLHSLVEHRGLIDLSRALDSQRRRLEEDTRYPAELYITQRFRQEHPRESGGRDGRPPVEDDVLRRIVDWLGDEGARFVTVLGDFGRGKTFLMRQLVTAIPERLGGLAPLLLQLHLMEKGPNLYDLVGQYLRRLDGGGGTDPKVRHMVAHGRVTLLLDGFDELVQRVSYPTAAAYLETLLAAATGEAKIVLTSRSQHFRDDSQIRQALLGTATGRDACRIVTLEDFSNDQIRRFLTGLYGGDGARADQRFDRLGEIKDLLGLSRNPRMLAFIAALPDAKLDQAQRGTDRISAADLYREILDHWLSGEVTRQKVRYGRRPLPEAERLAACRALAVHLWTAPDSDGETATLDDLEIMTRDALAGLESVGFSDEHAIHAVGSGSLLTRTDAGFGFVHRSVMEWLVADTAAAELAAGRAPQLLAAREMPDLMTDFLCDLAGHTTATDWAQRTHHDKEPRDASTATRRANATRVLARLSRRAGDTPAGVTTRAPQAGRAAADPAALAPLDLSGQDLRDQDITGLALSRSGGAGLAAATLRDTTWTGMILRDLDLSGADLSGADLSGVQLDRVDLEGARLTRARLTRAQLDGVRLAGADLSGADLTQARLTDTDPTRAVLTGSTWRRATVLDAAAVTRATAHVALATAAIPGRDPAIPSLAGTGAARVVTAVPDHGLIAVARGATIELIDLETALAVRAMSGHRGWVLSVCAVPGADGRSLLASGGADGTVRLWDPATGQPAGAPLTGHRGSVLSVCAVPGAGGRGLLASGGADGTVRLWDPATGQPVDARLTGHRGSVWSVCAVPGAGGRSLLASGGTDATVKLWDPVTGRPVGAPLTGHTSSVRSVCAVPGAKGRSLLASGRSAHH
jgi:uncharacterized protein YjbI with pentapeptide repeats/3',5'-cyclic AMP phosphodiesterase CpdA